VDDSGDILFTAGDIVRFDWEQQLVELRRERAMDLMAALVPHTHLQRSFTVRDADGDIYSGRFFSPASSQSYDGPTILTSFPGFSEAPPLFAIQGGYPGTIGEGAKKRFHPRLRADLEKAGLLKLISPADKPQPIERIHTEWCGDRNQHRFRAEIFPETFRIGQTARVHLFFTPPALTQAEAASAERDIRARLAGKAVATAPPIFDTVQVSSTLSQTNGFFCTTDHSIAEKLTPETIKSGFYLLRWKPWGTVYGAVKSTAEPGPATLSFTLTLRKQTTNGLEVVSTATIPPQKLTILP